MSNIMDLINRATWMGDGLCAQADPEVWFPEKGGSANAARRICKQCPVQPECLTDGMGERYGIWGGLTELERAAIRKESSQ